MKITYEVEVTGHAAPFKWQLVRQQAGKRTTLNSGQCDTHEDCLWEAQDAARTREYDRRHAATKRTEVLFEVDPEDSPSVPPALSEPGAWPEFNEPLYDGA